MLVQIWSGAAVGRPWIYGFKYAAAVPGKFLRRSKLVLQGQAAGLPELLVGPLRLDPQPGVVLGDPFPGHEPGYPVLRRCGDGYGQGDFLAALAAAGVEQCSIEAEVIDFESDVSEAYEVLKNFR